jgi:hypothetical protein
MLRFKIEKPDNNSDYKLLGNGKNGELNTCK